MIKVENVTKKYGDYVAVNNISFTINDGEIIRIFRAKWSRENYNNEHDNWIYRVKFRKY
ncbi:MAG: hypothetical protein HFJ24_05540 [Clostridia bacterium]|nr:hypothetical protein [Clostridia bacterium]MCI9275420.1 hypothetical protein [Clostridia bacterium]